MAEAASWTGQLPVAIEARERAFAAATRIGDVEAAATAGLNLARDNVMRMATDVSRAWTRRVERMLEGVDEGPGHDDVTSTAADPCSSHDEPRR